MFSSRGRHTILVSDWSSDVCSSDLGTVTLDASGVAHPSASQGPLSAGSYSFIAHYNGDPNYTATDSPCEPLEVKIGRASCREGVQNASHTVVVAEPAGTTVHEQATLTGTFGTPTCMQT